MSIFTVTLTAGKLEPLVREETPNCTQLGVQLSISLPRLNDLKQQSRDKKPSKECFQEMLQQWLQDKDVDRKWCEIYEALDQQGNRRLKADLEKKYAADTRGKVMFHCVLILHFCVQLTQIWVTSPKS